MELLNFDRLKRTFAANPHGLRILAALASVLPEDESSSPALTRLLFAIKPEDINRVWFPGIHPVFDYAAALTGTFSDKFHRHHLGRVLSGRGQGNCLADGLAVAAPKTTKGEVDFLVARQKSLPQGIAEALSVHRPRAGALKGGEAAAVAGIPGTGDICAAIFGDLKHKRIREQAASLFSGHTGYGEESDLAAIKFLCRRAGFRRLLARDISLQDTNFSKAEILFAAREHHARGVDGDERASFMELTPAPGCVGGLLMSPGFSQEQVNSLFEDLPEKIRKIGGSEDALAFALASLLRHPNTPQSIYQKLLDSRNPHIAKFLGDRDGKPNPFAFDFFNSQSLPYSSHLALESSSAPAQKLADVLLEIGRERSNRTPNWQRAVDAIDNPSFPLSSLKKGSSFFDGEIISCGGFQEQGVVLPIAVAAAVRDREFAEFLGGHINNIDAATALLFSPATSSKRLDAIAKTHPLLAPVCTIHQNGHDIDVKHNQFIAQMRKGNSPEPLMGRGGFVTGVDGRASLLEI